MKTSAFYKLSQRYIYLVNDLGGTYKDEKERPVYCCIQDKKSPEIYWAIPTSSIAGRPPAQIERIKRLCDLPGRDIRASYYHIGHTNRPAIYKISNALPVTEGYIESEYVSQGCHLILRDKKLIGEIQKKLARILFDESRHPNKYEQHMTSVYAYLTGEGKRSLPAARGIIISGAAGSGKTTLAKALAAKLGCAHLDLDNYYLKPDNDNPFSGWRTRSEILKLLTSDLEGCTRFVMSGSIGDLLWDFVNPLFELAVLLSVPTDIRLQRVKARAYEHFGDRVLEGGDLYENHQQFYGRVRQYDSGFHVSSLDWHEKWARELPCPLLRADGTKLIEENATWLAGQYQALLHI